MKDLLIGIATLIVALIIIGTLILGKGDNTLQSAVTGKVEDGIKAINSLDFTTEQK